VLLKLLLIQEEEPGDSYPVISEWGRGMGSSPGQVRVALGQSVVNLKCGIFYEFQTFSNFSLPQSGRALI
jgi:hypothetical protein